MELIFQIVCKKNLIFKENDKFVLATNSKNPDITIREISFSISFKGSVQTEEDINIFVTEDGLNVHYGMYLRISSRYDVTENWQYTAFVDGSISYVVLPDKRTLYYVSDPREND